MSYKFKIPVTLAELSIEVTLQCGQSFRWRKTPQGTWRGVLGSALWVLKQDLTYLHCQVIEGRESTITGTENKRKKYYKEFIEDYFRLDVKLETLYNQWSQADPTFALLAKDFPGIRILNQHPVENTFSFICSSNNNIKRITLLVDRLCEEFGSKMLTFDGNDWYTFPSIESLAAQGVENKLRDLGFGYRAKYIGSSANTIMTKGGEKWLCSLKKGSYEECHSNLNQLSGVGAKVADCICLMSMNHLGAIPVDTHVFQIAARDYLPHLRGSKSVTKSIYSEIGNHFREIFGPYAGWAHSVLFSADLKKFQNKSKDHQECDEEKPTKKKLKKHQN